MREMTQECAREEWQELRVQRQRATESGTYGTLLAAWLRLSLDERDLYRAAVEQGGLDVREVRPAADGARRFAAELSKTPASSDEGCILLLRALLAGADEPVAREVVAYATRIPLRGKAVGGEPDEPHWGWLLRSPDVGVRAAATEAVCRHPGEAWAEAACVYLFRGAPKDSKVDLIAELNRLTECAPAQRATWLRIALRECTRPGLSHPIAANPDSILESQSSTPIAKELVMRVLAHRAGWPGPSGDAARAKLDRCSWDVDPEVRSTAANLIRDLHAVEAEREERERRRESELDAEIEQLKDLLSRTGPDGSSAARDTRAFLEIMVWGRETAPVQRRLERLARALHRISDCDGSLPATLDGVVDTTELEPFVYLPLCDMPIADIPKRVILAVHTAPITPPALTNGDPPTVTFALLAPKDVRMLDRAAFAAAWERSNAARQVVGSKPVEADVLGPLAEWVNP